MSENKSKLRIHAQITPEQHEKTVPKAVRWRCIQHPQSKRRSNRKLNYGERLLRNSALACAALLAVLAVGNINQPWARRTSATIEQALTMHIDLDESIGRLSFVRNLMPESALVFLNLSSDAELACPVNGELTHAYSEIQPWLTFSCASGSDVFAAADGIVTAVSALPEDATGILIDHGNGTESVYACMEKSDVQPGDTISRGQVLGTADSMLYFELRENELPVDPTERMGL